MISRFYTVIILYTIFLLLIFIFKPAMMFDARGHIKHFDYEEENISSLLNIEIVAPILAILCYFIVISVEMIMT